ncbi:MAG: hypothetical protein AB7G13_11585 [Lautropia sp.]
MATDWSRAAVFHSDSPPYTRVVCSGNQNNHDRYSAEDWSGATWTDATYIAAANPVVIAALLAERDRLAAEMGHLSGDAARIDWLDRQWRDGVHLEVCAEQMPGGMTHHTLRPTAAIYGRTSTVATGASAREAIDAAMTKDPK